MRYTYAGFTALLLTIALLVGGCDNAIDANEEEEVGPRVQFATSGAGAVPDDSTAEITVEIVNPNGNAVSAEVLFAEGASTAEPTDVGGLTVDNPLEVSFSAGAEDGATETVTVDIADADITEGAKEAHFALQNVQSDGPVEVGSPREFTLSIGPKPIAEARADGVGATVTIQGTVTRAFGSYARIQDESGATGASGIMIRQVDGSHSEEFQADISSGNIRPGTELILTGTISAFSGLLQINGDDLASYTVLSQGDVPEPQTVALPDLEAPDGEDYESELVRVEGLTFPEDDGSFQAQTDYTVEDEDGNTFLFRVQDDEETDVIGDPIPSGTFDFEGVIGQFNVFGEPDDHEGYQLLPVESSDVISEDDGEEEPGDGETVTIEEARTLEFGSEVIVEGTVSRAFGSYVRIQDDSGPTGASGVVIRQVDGSNSDAFQQDISDGNIQSGTVLRVTGTTSHFSGLVQIDGDDLVEYEIVEQGTEPSAQTVTLPDIEGPDGEDYESELLRVEELVFPDSSAGESFEGGTDYTVIDSDDNTFTFRIQDNEETNVIGETIPEGTFDFEGVLGQFNVFGDRDDHEGYQLLPVEPGDLQE